MTSILVAKGRVLHYDEYTRRKETTMVCVMTSIFVAKNDNGLRYDEYTRREETTGLHYDEYTRREVTTMVCVMTSILVAIFCVVTSILVVRKK